MHPAPSVIVFTTFSGLGFGLLAYLGAGLITPSGWIAFGFFFLAFAMAVGGLLASVFHLANPKNAIKAFSQWRSSWLSREGIAALVALITMGLFAVGIIFFNTRIDALGWIGAAFSLLTVFTTSMIYTQLKSIPRWNQTATPLHFISLSLAGGALLAGLVEIASILLLLAALVQLWTWQKGDKRFTEAGSTLETATGLPGATRQFEPPHTGQNYLLKEMVFNIGRKHVFKLRMIAFGLAFAVPYLLLIALPVGHLVALVAVLSHVAGVMASRWLFFAQAEHVVGLYYGNHLTPARSA